MQVIILAGGFGKRLGELGTRFSKALLPMKPGVVLDHVVDRVWVEGIRTIHVVYAQKWAQEFKAWKKSALWHPKPGERQDGPYIKLHSNSARSAKESLGAVGDLRLVTDILGASRNPEGAVVVCGDNLYPKIDWKELAGAFSSSLVCRPSGKLDEVFLTDTIGVTEIEDGHVIGITEGVKDRAKDWVWAGPAFLHHEDFPAVAEFCDYHQRSGVLPDSLGGFFDCLTEMSKAGPVRAIQHNDGDFGDVGSQEAYQKTRIAFAVPNDGRPTTWRRKDLRKSASGPLTPGSGSRSQEPLNELLKRLKIPGR